MSKVTLDSLIKQKEKLLNKTPKTATIEVESLGGSITIQAPTASMAKDAQEMKDGDNYIVYQCVIEPNLKDANLQKEFGCTSPLDIVEKIFEAGSIPQIAVECLKLAGYIEGVKVINDLKN